TGVFGGSGEMVRAAAIAWLKLGAALTERTSAARSCAVICALVLGCHVRSIDALPLRGRATDADAKRHAIALRARKREGARPRRSRAMRVAASGDRCELEATSRSGSVRRIWCACALVSCARVRAGTGASGGLIAAGREGRPDREAMVRCVRRKT